MPLLFLDEDQAVADEALAAALGAGTRQAGPVHLNLPFREPLTPQDEPETPSEPPAVQPSERSARVMARLESGPRTVVVAGDRARDGACNDSEQIGYLKHWRPHFPF